MTERLFKGVAASPGLALGTVAFFKRLSVIPQAQSSQNPDTEWHRFHDAVGRLELGMVELQGRIPSVFSNDTLQIFSMYKALVEDPSIEAAVRRHVFDEGSTAEWGIYQAFQKALEVIIKVPHEHIAEKADDIETVRDLLLEALGGGGGGGGGDGWVRFAGSVVVCARLTPRDILQLAREGVAGVVSETGTRTSHVAILARNLGIPAVLGVGNCCSLVRAGEQAALDGGRGLFEVSPSEDHLSIFKVRNQVWLQYGNEVLARAALPVVTADGEALLVRANVESAREIDEAKAKGAAGVGLLRLEFFYMGQPSLPSEELIFKEVDQIARALPNNDVVVRLLDAGGDKDIPCLGLHETQREGLNPSMGLRGIRVLLRHPEILVSQVRAILRANCSHKNVSLLIPFVSSLEEVRAVRLLVQQEWETLSATLAIPPPIPLVGMMVEVPSAVAAVDLFAREVDFFSIGTNDLTQHLLAVDRGDEAVSLFYDSFHPALIRSLRTVLDASLAVGLPVTLCGEMAAEPLCLELLVGLGLRSFSMNVNAIPYAKDVLREVSCVEAEALLSEVLLLRTAQEVKGRLQARFVEKFGLERYAMIGVA